MLALPFSILRSSVDYSQAGLQRRQDDGDPNELGMGTNTKIHLQFTSRFWSDQGCNGETYSDRGYQNTWEVTRAQDGAERDPRLVHGRQRRRVASAAARRTRRRGRSCRQIEPVLPGATAKWNGR